MKHVNITINGRVQGVGFRYSAQIVAKNLSIKGFVKNKKDRTVYIEAEGEEQNIDAFIEWCRKGPDRAHIQSTTIIPSDMRDFKSFEVAF